MVDQRYTTRPPVSSEPADDQRAWFAPRRFGYGAGLPIRWQGWALLAGYVTVALIAKVLDDRGGGGMRATAFALVVAATVILITVAARRTLGGWKWRWGNDN